MYLQTLVILLSVGNTFCNFLRVSDGCKYWNYLKVYGNGEPKKVHCILDQDFQSGLVFTEWKMITKGTCPIYNRFAGQIDSIPCNKNIGICPNDTFPSYSGVTYTGCYDAIRKKTNVMRPTTNENVHVPPAVSDNSNYPIGLVVIATVLACTNCMFIIFCVWHFICRSKIKLRRDEYRMPRSNVGKTSDYIAIEPVHGNGANAEFEMRRGRGDENGVLDASTLVADKYGMVIIPPDEPVAYLESKPDDAKVQNLPYSRRTSETSSANSKASEDHPVDTESGREPYYT